MSNCDDVLFAKYYYKMNWVLGHVEYHWGHVEGACVSWGHVEYQTKLAACNREQGKLYKVCNSLIGVRKTDVSIENCNSDQEAADAFSDFFVDSEEDPRQP